MRAPGAQPFYGTDSEDDEPTSGSGIAAELDVHMDMGEDIEQQYDLADDDAIQTAQLPSGSGRGGQHGDSPPAVPSPALSAKQARLLKRQEKKRRKKSERAAAATAAAAGAPPAATTAATSNGHGAAPAPQPASAPPRAHKPAHLRPSGEHTWVLQSPPAADGFLLLFDIHGVMGHKVRQANGRTDHKLRPAVEHILRLVPHFTVGVYSSATSSTVTRAIASLQAELAAAARTKGVAAHLPKPLFSLILHRKHCRPDPHWRQRPDGAEWDTIKPLKLHGLDMRRTILIDNEAHKAYGHETANMVLMPEWSGQPEPKPMFPVLVDALLHHLRHVQDVRRAVPAVNAALAAAGAGGAPAAAAIAGAGAAGPAAAGQAAELAELDSGNIIGDMERRTLRSSHLSPAPSLSPTGASASAAGTAASRSGVKRPADAPAEAGKPGKAPRGAAPAAGNVGDGDISYEGQESDSERELDDLDSAELDALYAQVDECEDDENGEYEDDEEFEDDDECEDGGEYEKDDDFDDDGGEYEDDGEYEEVDEELDDDDDGGYYSQDEEDEWEDRRRSSLPGAAGTSGSAASGGGPLAGGMPLYAELLAERAGTAGGAAVGGGSSGRGGSVTGGGGFSALHREVELFAQRCTPTPAELQQVRTILDRLEDLCRGLWPSSRCVLFGSQASGLALPGSDLDVVILGTGVQLSRPAQGFMAHEKGTVKRMLGALQTSLRRTGLLRRAQLIHARVPIIKAELNVNGQPVAVDISIGAVNGAAAVHYVSRQLAALPPLRPLTLVAKALLKEASLNEVFTGGLSSYVITLMAIAHLQAEGFEASREGGIAQRDMQWRTHEEQVSYLDSLRRQPQTVADLGALLLGFLRRYGCLFRLESEAVSVPGGGIVAKRRDWKGDNPSLMAVEDPQQPGRDIAHPSVAAPLVQRHFAHVFQRLTAVLQSPGSAATAAAAASGSGSGAAAAAAGSPHGRGRNSASGAGRGSDDGDGWAAVQADGQHRTAGSFAVLSGDDGTAGPSSSAGRGADGGDWRILGAVLDVCAALGRDAASLKARQALERRNGERRNGDMAALRAARPKQRKFKDTVLQGEHGAALAAAHAAAAAGRGGTWAGGVKLPKKPKKVALRALQHGQRPQSAVNHAGGNGVGVRGVHAPKHFLNQATPQPISKKRARQQARQAAEEDSARAGKKRKGGGRGWSAEGGGGGGGGSGGGAGGHYVQHNSTKWAALRAQKRALKKSAKDKAKSRGAAGS